METLQTLKFYNRFREAVKKRTVDNMVVPVSGGLDSTLIVKALHDNKDLDKCKFLCLCLNPFAEMVESRYDIFINHFEIEEQPNDNKLMVEILEEPLYSKSVNFYLYKEINRLGSRVSLSGLGADELFGGYDYYNTINYPRGLFEEIKAVTNEEKKERDLYFLIHHHLRENERIGLYWEVEGRYPFLDKEVVKFNDVGKSMIKSILLEDFSNNFVNRQKTGFRIDDNKDRSHQRKEYLKQLEIWRGIFK